MALPSHFPVFHVEKVLHMNNSKLLIISTYKTESVNTRLNM